MKYYFSVEYYYFVEYFVVENYLVALVVVSVVGWHAVVSVVIVR